MCAKHDRIEGFDDKLRAALRREEHRQEDHIDRDASAALAALARPGVRG